MTIDLTTELLAPSGTALKFEAEGDVQRIVIETAEKQQETSYDDGSPVFWPSGDPKYQIVITGKDLEGNAAKLYVKGYMTDAFKDALREAGVKAGDDISGGTLAVKWESTDEPRKAGMKGARRYKATFKPAPKAAVTDDLI